MVSIDSIRRRQRANTLWRARFSDVTQLVPLASDGKLYAKELVGDDPFSLTAGSNRLHVKELLGILTPSDVPIIRCVGLNYMKHSGLRIPFQFSCSERSINTMSS